MACARWFPEVRGWLAATVLAAALVACGSPTEPGSSTFRISCPVAQEVTDVERQPGDGELRRAVGERHCGARHHEVHAGERQQLRPGLDLRDLLGPGRPRAVGLLQLLDYGHADAAADGHAVPGVRRQHHGRIARALLAGGPQRVARAARAARVSTDRRSRQPGVFVPGRPEGAARARYALQPVDVVNEGLAAETVTDGVVTSPATVSRLRTALIANSAQVVLLLEGVNDLSLQAPVATIARGVRDLVREARQRGAQVLVATLLPQSGSCRGTKAAVIPAVNDAIRAMAAQENAPLVDLYQGFNGSASPYIGSDGLHPNELGYQRVADIFFAVIRERFEVGVR